MAVENLLNVPKSTLTEFMDDLEGKLALLTGIIDSEQVQLTKEKIRKPMLVIGLPGIGKTCGIKSIIERLNETKLKGTGKELGFKKILLGQTVVGSLSGIPVVKPDGTVVRIQMPDLPDAERDGEYGVLFLDEITTADEAQVQPALGLTDDTRNIGEYTLPENWLVVAAGNGPDCTNFIRLDDMTISRFSVYDISYNFQTDWRPYALSHGVNDDIIAYLNFEPSSCVQVESTDMDDSGKAFACPRSWERLSDELKMREVMGRKVQRSELGRFCGRIIGINAARRFQSFCECVENIEYDAEKIALGKEREPEAGMKKEIFFAVLQKCTKYLKNLISECDEIDMQIDAPDYIVSAVANTIRWFVTFENYDLDACINAVMQLKSDDENIRNVIVSEMFTEEYPEFDDFLDRHAELILSNIDLLGMGF